MQRPNGYICVGGPWDNKMYPARTHQRVVMLDTYAGDYSVALDRYIRDFYPLTILTQIPFWRYSRLTHDEAVARVAPQMWGSMKGYVRAFLHGRDTDG